MHGIVPNHLLSLTSTGNISISVGRGISNSRQLGPCLPTSGSGIITYQAKSQPERLLLYLIRPGTSCVYVVKQSIFHVDIEGRILLPPRGSWLDANESIQNIHLPLVHLPLVLALGWYLQTDHRIDIIQTSSRKDVNHKIGVIEAFLRCVHRMNPNWSTKNVTGSSYGFNMAHAM